MRLWGKLGLVSMLVGGIIGAGGVTASAESSVSESTGFSTTLYALQSNAATKSAKPNFAVIPTGKYALTTKASYLKGAKPVASRAKMKTLATSTDVGDYFQPYRHVKTKTGRVYYKVVSFDQQLTGWVYGGRTNNKYAGGLKQVQTVTALKLPAVTTGYVTVPNRSVTAWPIPQGTSYSSGTPSQLNPNDHFSIVDAAQAKRGGALYYKLVDSTTSTLVGWVSATEVAQPMQTTVTQSSDGTVVTGSGTIIMSPIQPK